MRWIFVLGLLFVLIACVPQPPVEVKHTNQHARGTIIAVGDSLTAGYGVPLNQSYPAQLEKLLKKQGYNYEVINMGVNGETTFGTLKRLDTVIAQKPNIVILAVGANDALRLFDPKVTHENIDQMVQQLQTNNITVILAGSPVVRVNGWSYPEQFTRIYPAIAKEHHLTYMPFFLQGVVGNESLNLQDGVHPNAKGYAIIAQNMLPYIEKEIEKK